MAKQVKAIDTPNLNAPISAKLIGLAIKARRTQSQLRLEDAAALCHVSKHTFMKIEHGQETAQLNSLLQICRGLGIKIQILPWGPDDCS